MLLDEAAQILGVHPDAPIETLKQTYRRQGERQKSGESEEPGVLCMAHDVLLLQRCYYRYVSLQIIESHLTWDYWTRFVFIVPSNLPF